MRETKPRKYKGRRAVFTYDCWARDRYISDNKGGRWDRQITVVLGSKVRTIWIDTTRLSITGIHTRLQMYSIKKNIRSKNTHRITSREAAAECFKASIAAKKGRETVTVVNGRTEYTHEGQVVATLEGVILTLNSHGVDTTSRRKLLNEILDAFKEGNLGAFNGIFSTGAGFAVSWCGHVVNGPLKIDIEKGQVLSDLEPAEQYAKLSRLRGMRQINHLASRLKKYIPMPDRLPPEVLGKLVDMRMKGIL